MKKGLLIGLGALALSIMSGCSRETLESKHGRYMGLSTYLVNEKKGDKVTARHMFLQRGEYDTFEEVIGRDLDNDGHFEKIEFRNVQPDSDLQRFATQEHLNLAYDRTNHRMRKSRGKYLRI